MTCRLTVDYWDVEKHRIRRKRREWIKAAEAVLKAPIATAELKAVARRCLEELSRTRMEKHDA